MKRVPAILFFLFAMTLVLLFFAFTSGEQPVEQEQTTQLQQTAGVRDLHRHRRGARPGRVPVREAWLRGCPLRVPAGA